MAGKNWWLRRAAPDDGSEDRKLDTSVAYSARVNNYWQGGKDNFAADRAAAEQAIRAFPALPEALRAGQAFRLRVARYLVAEAGLRQFLDIGTGLPAADTYGQIADSLAVGCRFVYVDKDPMVLAHARALLTCKPGACAYLDADLRDTESILTQAAQTLDFTLPVGIILSSILHLIPDSDAPYAIVKLLMDTVAPGSYLVIVHPSSDIRPEASAKMAANLNRMVAQKRTYRGHADVSRFFSGLELVEPGVVPVPEWRPDSESEAKEPTLAWCGVARKSAGTAAR